MSKRFLIEFSEEINSNKILGKSLSVRDSDYEVEPDFLKNKESYTLFSGNKKEELPWDEAHGLIDHFFSKGIPIDFVEPDKENLFINSRNDFHKEKTKKEESAPSKKWYLEKEYSQLKKARARAKKYFTDDSKRVKIGFINFQNDSSEDILLPEVVQIPLADSNASAFVKALEHASDIGCEVVAVSVSEFPSIIWASAINRAYENGVTVVAPAEKLNGHFLFPANWERVIAVSGAKQTDLISDFENSSEKSNSINPMQNMVTGYVSHSKNSSVVQVAEAAALWIQRFRKDLDKAKSSGTWKQVEAVRTGLFKSAELPEFRGAEKHLGNGCLKAAEALKKKHFPKKNDLKKASPSKVFLPIFKVFFGGRRGVPVHEGKLEMYSTELYHLAAGNPELQELLLADLTFEDVENRQNIPAQEKFMEWRLALNNIGASDNLLQFMGLKGSMKMRRRL